MKIFWGRIIILLMLLISAICEIIALAALAATRDDIAAALLISGVAPGVLVAAMVAIIERWVRR